MSQNKIGIIGCGWLGLPLAKEFVSNNYKVKGSTTTKEKLEILKNEGIDAYLIDVAENSISNSFESFLYELDILIVNIPPKIRKDANSNYSEKIKELVKQANKVKNILFISSTSVYGSMQGKIDSNTIALPDSENGKEILKTENIIKNKNNTILRFGGLIGEGRNPLKYLIQKERLKTGASSADHRPLPPAHAHLGELVEAGAPQPAGFFVLAHDRLEQPSRGVRDRDGALEHVQIDALVLGDDAVGR